MKPSHSLPLQRLRDVIERDAPDRLKSALGKVLFVATESRYQAVSSASEVSPVLLRALRAASTSVACCASEPPSRVADTLTSRAQQ